MLPYGFLAGDQLIFKAESRSATLASGQQRTKFYEGSDCDLVQGSNSSAICRRGRQPCSDRCSLLQNFARRPCVYPKRSFPIVLPSMFSFSTFQSLFVASGSEVVAEYSSREALGVVLVGGWGFTSRRQVLPLVRRLYASF